MKTVNQFPDEIMKKRFILNGFDNREAAQKRNHELAITTS